MRLPLPWFQPLPRPVLAFLQIGCNRSQEALGCWAFPNQWVALPSPRNGSLLLRVNGPSAALHHRHPPLACGPVEEDAFEDLAPPSSAGPDDSSECPKLRIFLTQNLHKVGKQSSLFVV